MAIPTFRYRLNADTDRWEIVQRIAGGKDMVVCDYATADEARAHVVRDRDNAELELPS